MSTNPAPAPLYLPSAEVANSGTDPVAYYARLVLLDGSVATLDGSQLLALSGFDFGAQVPPATSSSGAAATPTLSPLTFSVADPALSAALLALQSSNRTLGEIDILGYRTSDGALVSDASFGLAHNTSVTSTAGSVSFTADYTAIALQHQSPAISGALTADPSGSWDTTTHAPGFSSASGAPAAAPAVLPASGVAGAGGADTYEITAVSGTNPLATFTGTASGGISLSGNGSVGLAPLTLTLDNSSLNQMVQAFGDPKIVTIGTYNASGILIGDETFALSSSTVDFRNVGTDTTAVTLDPKTAQLDSIVGGQTVDIVKVNGGVAPFSPALTISKGGADTQFIRLYDQSGNLVTIGGVSLFPVSAVSLGATTTNGSNGARVLTGGTLSVSLGNSPLDVTLSTLFDSGTTFQEVDILGYSGTKLAEESSLGGAFGQGLTVAAGGGGVATFGYQALELQSWTNGTADQASFIRGTALAAFPNGGPQAAPSIKPTTALTLTPETYYVRFVSTSGSILTAGGAQYFALDTAGNGTAVPSQVISGKLQFGIPTFDPLSLALSDPAAAPALLSQLTSGTKLGEIDVLGYNSAGTLVQAQSFGAATVSTVQITTGGTLQLSAAYGSEAQQQSYVGTTSGTLSSSWNSATNGPGFSNGAGGTQPRAAPATLPLTGVAGNAPPLDYYVQVYSASGVKLTLDGATLFALQDYSAAATVPASSTGTTGSVTLSPLNLTLIDPLLAANLLNDVAQVTTLGEVDVLAYDPTTGKLASQATFGKVHFTAAAQNDGTVQLTAGYAATEVQQFSGSGLAQASWDSTTGTSAYAGIGRGAATLSAGSVDATAPSLDSYARFVLTDGSTLTLNGNQLFALSGYAADGTVQSATQSTETFVPGPVTLSLTQAALTPTMLANLVKGGRSPRWTCSATVPLPAAIRPCCSAIRAS